MVFLFFTSLIIQFLLNFLAFDYTLRTKTTSSFTTHDSCHGEIKQDVAFGKSFSFSIKRLNTEVLFLFRDPSLKSCGLIAWEKFLRNMLCVRAPYRYECWWFNQSELSSLPFG